MKANQVTAFSAVVIAIGVVYIIANNIYKERQYREIQQERAIEFQKRQKFTNTNTACRENYADGFIRDYLFDETLKFTAQRLLKECMEVNGYANLECGRYGVCKQK